MTTRMSETPFTIGELSKAAGVPTSTVRFYERRGLLQPDGRSRGNYRVYTEAALGRVRFIRAAHDAGFTIADTQRLLAEVDGEPETCAHIQNLITERLARVEAMRTQLAHAREVLTRWLAECRCAASAGRCVVLGRLTTEAAPLPKPKRRPAKEKLKKTPNDA